MALFPVWQNSCGWTTRSSNIGRSGYSTARRVLLAAVDRSVDAPQESFNQLPPEVKRGFSREKTYSSRRSNGKSSSSTAAAGDASLEQDPPLVFNLKSHLTGRRHDLSWQYSWPWQNEQQQQQDAASSSGSGHGKNVTGVDHPSPWGPVSAFAEHKAMKVLLQPGEFTSSSQLGIERMRQIAQECVPVPWLLPMLSPTVTSSSASQSTSVSTSLTVEDYSDGSDDCTHIGSTTSSSTSSSSISITDRPPTPQKTVVSHDAFLETMRRYGGERMLLEQALSLRKQLLVDKIVNDGWRLRKHGERMRKAYQQGVSLLDLAVQYDQPPVAIFRDMLTTKVRAHKRFEDLRDRDKRNLVKAGLRGDGPAWEMMSERDRAELAAAKAVDHTSYAEEDSTGEANKQFSRTLG
jgi:hypothetical protein